MGRRINIQYSIDIDDLGLEVQTGRPLSLEKMEHIDELRRKLAAIDYTLQDTHNIISAYLSFKSEEAMPTTEDPPRGKESEEPPQE